MSLGIRPETLCSALAVARYESGKRKNIGKSCLFGLDSTAYTGAYVTATSNDPSLYLRNFNLVTERLGDRPVPLRARMESVAAHE